MDAQRFDNLIRSLFAFSARRRLLTALIGNLLAALPLWPGVEVEAKKRKRRKKKRRKKKKRGCKNAGNCPRPSDPCLRAVCRKRKCRTARQANGTSCGEGLVCFNGQCAAACDLSGAPCEDGETCCAEV